MPSDKQHALTRAAQALSHRDVLEIILAAVLAVFQIALEFRHTRRELYRQQEVLTLGCKSVSCSSLRMRGWGNWGVHITA